MGNQTQPPAPNPKRMNGRSMTPLRVAISSGLSGRRVIVPNVQQAVMSNHGIRSHPIPPTESVPRIRATSAVPTTIFSLCPLSWMPLSSISLLTAYPPMPAMRKQGASSTVEGSHAMTPTRPTHMAQRHPHASGRERASAPSSGSSNPNEAKRRGGNVHVTVLRRISGPFSAS